MPAGAVGGGAVATSCQPGLGLNGTYCMPCANGTYSLGGKTACLTCSAPKTGEYVFSACTSTANAVIKPCTAYKNGYSKNGTCSGGKDTQFTACPAGSYSNGTATTCSKCAAGTMSITGASSCGTCMAGYYSAAGAGACIACGTNTYSAAGAGACTACGAGYTSGTGASSCTKTAAAPATASATTPARFYIKHNSTGKYISVFSFSFSTITMDDKYAGNSGRQIFTYDSNKRIVPVGSTSKCLTTTSYDNSIQLTNLNTSTSAQFTWNSSESRFYCSTRYMTASRDLSLGMTSSTTKDANSQFTLESVATTASISTFEPEPEPETPQPMSWSVSGFNLN